MKKHSFKSILSLLTMLAVVFSFHLPADAEDSGVTFEDGKIIAFQPGSVSTDTDLFDNFKGVMPGDVRTEEITVQNNTKDCDYIKVYMRAVLFDETGNPVSEKVLAELKADRRREPVTELNYMYDFLSQLSMKVWNGTTLIYEGSPDKLNGLAENVLLGTVRNGESIKLSVELDVPANLGNEYSSRIGDVGWTFVIEGFDDPTPLPEENTELTVRKVWVDNGKNRPDSVKVQLLKDKQVQETIELNQSNKWTYSWDSLEKGAAWSVQETDIPKGYKVSYKTDGTMIIITNTAKNANPATVIASLIQTGQLNWPIPVLGSLGVLLIAYGIIVMIKKRKHEEK